MKKLIALTLALFTSTVSAQIIGQVHVTKGQVIMQANGASTSISSIAPVQNGNKIVVPSGAVATVTLANDCVISLQGSQVLVVDSALKCADLQASVTQFTVPQVAVIGGLTAISAASFSAIKNDKKVSGS